MKVVSVVGARPQFVKIAALERALVDRGVEHAIVHTGQHHDPELSDVFFEELELSKPVVNLGIAGGSHGRMTGRMLEALDDVLPDLRPHWVVAVGDTNSTVAAALAAVKLGMRVAHLEAGLRSFNRSMPEEINRVVTDHLSHLLLCPTPLAVENLAEEGVRSGVHHVGDVMYDVFLHAAAVAEHHSSILERLDLVAGGYAVATVHRAATTDEPDQLRAAVAYLQQVAETTPVVFPVHPRAAAALDSFGVDTRGLLTCPPVSYLDMVRLLSNASLVLTDSGGLQKEAYFARVPCVTLRSETEWVETIDHGWNRLWTELGYAERRPIHAYGVGRAGDRVAELLVAESDTVSR